MKYFAFVFWFTIGGIFYHLFIGKNYEFVLNAAYSQFLMAAWFCLEDRKLCKKSK